MKTKTRIFLSLAAIIFGLFIFSCKTSKQTEEEHYVVMLSVDGFRWDYPDSISTPNLDFIASKGVKAKSLKPCFPTKTFPNHYSMATGLYPDHHGIVLNNFYAPDMDKHYSIGNREVVENGNFYGGEPIWVTAEKQDVISASFFWVGSEAPVKGIRPTYWKRYDHYFPFEQRIDSVIAWLQLPENKRPHLILWYIHEPDSKGHDFGPDSKEIEETVIYLDSLIGVFINKVEQLPYSDKINIIITSDHGMCNISTDRNVILDEYIQSDWFEHIKGGNPVYCLDAKDEYYDTAFICLNLMPHVKVWEHGKLPKRLNYGTNPRTLDFIIAADSSWSIRWKKQRPYAGGTHGYDNDNTDMHAIFYAMGPAFKINYIHPTFNNVDIYPLISEILKLQPAEVDGKLENVSEMLKN
jgi:alkaline phosphatase D